MTLLAGTIEILLFDICKASAESISYRDPNTKRISGALPGQLYCNTKFLYGFETIRRYSPSCMPRYGHVEILQSLHI